MAPAKDADLLLKHGPIASVKGAYSQLVKAEVWVKDYLERSHEFGDACSKVFKGAEMPQGKTHMPYKDAIGRLNYWFEAMSPLLASKGLLARLPEIAEARHCITKEKWKNNGMSEDDFTTFYYSVLKSVANYQDGSTVPTVSWDTEPGDLGLLNSEGNPVAASPLYERTAKPKAKWTGDEDKNNASVKSLSRMMTKSKGENNKAAEAAVNSDSEDSDDDDLFFDMPDGDEDDFDSAMAVFNYMSLPSFDKRKQDSDGEDKGRRRKDDDEEDAAYFADKKKGKSKKPVIEESESSDDDAEMQALAMGGARIEDDNAHPEADDKPFAIDADGVSSGLKEGEIF